MIAFEKSSHLAAPNLDFDFNCNRLHLVLGTLLEIKVYQEGDHK